jgi:fermentation-respiration switch protein FrsA (DUF1100 family)
MQKLNCPLFLLHGKKDSLIPCTHSEELFDNCSQPCYLHHPLDMDHNEFMIEDDLIAPITAFVNQVQRRKELIYNIVREKHNPTHAKQQTADKKKESIENRGYIGDTSNNRYFKY